MKELIKSFHLFGCTFAIITFSTIGIFIASVLCFFLASVCDQLRLVAQSFVCGIHQP